MQRRQWTSTTTGACTACSIIRSVTGCTTPACAWALPGYCNTSWHSICHDRWLPVCFEGLPSNAAQVPSCPVVSRGLPCSGRQHPVAATVWVFTHHISAMIVLRLHVRVATNIAVFALCRRARRLWRPPQPRLTRDRARAWRRTTTPPPMRKPSAAAQLTSSLAAHQSMGPPSHLCA